MVNTKIVLMVFFAAKDGEALYRQQKEDQELTVAHIMNSLLPNKAEIEEKVRKTTRSFRYYLNQIPYYSTVEVTNRLKGLDLIDGVPEELWTEVWDIVHESVIKTISKINECKMVTVVWGGLTNIYEKKKC